MFGHAPDGIDPEGALPEGALDDGVLDDGVLDDGVLDDELPLDPDDELDGVVVVVAAPEVAAPTPNPSPTALPPIAAVNASILSFDMTTNLLETR